MKKSTRHTTLNLTLRPTRFRDVIGLRSEVAAIEALIKTERLPRAFLLSGPFGCGKTTLAYLIAEAVQGPGEHETKMFLREINAASVTGIDDMRDLIKSARMAPLSGRYNVIILDEAHKLSKPAQEALLKAFEDETAPTIWIICTSDREKIVEGLRAGRAFNLRVRGLDDVERGQLVARAAEAVGYTGDTSEFLGALARGDVRSPRKILMSFDAFVAGLSVEEAVGSMFVEALPEYWEIVMGVCYGSWSKPFTLSWVKGKEFPPVCEQLRLLEDRLKRKATTEAAPATPVEDDDVQGRPEVAQALRAITAATLKGQLVRQPARFNAGRAARAAEALDVLSHGMLPFGLEYALVIGLLYRVHTIMQEKKS